MINVSRTSVPESWFASPIPYKVTKPRDTKPLITVSQEALSEFNISSYFMKQNGRISVSTINTDLFPELITWAAIIESQSPASCSQRIPTDVHSKREADADTLHETSPPSPALSLILDPTSLAFGFDQLCLEGLDDCLTYSPRESFEEACWEQATCSRSGRKSGTQSTPRKFGRRADTYSPLTARGPFSDDDSDTDSKDSLTLGYDDVHLDIVDSGGMSDLHTTGDLLTRVSHHFVIFACTTYLVGGGYSLLILIL